MRIVRKSTILSVIVFALSATLVSAPSRLLAQPGGGVPVTGVVVDATTGQPVSGAFVTVGIPRGPRTVADSVGRFQLSNVPTGPQVLTAQRFGYKNVSVTVTVARNTARVEMRMEADPLAVEGITLGLQPRRALSGIVWDASNNERVPWAALRLTADLVRTETTGRADGDGVFLLPEVPPGFYQLHVELLGYEPTIVQVDIGARTNPIDVRLQPDRVVKEGLVKLTQDLRARRNAYPRAAVTYDVTKLNYSASIDALTFLANETSTDVAPCSGGQDRYCIGARGSTKPGKVFVDENPVGGLDFLTNYKPSDFYSLEIYNDTCIFAYTYTFAEARARRPRTFLGAQLAGC